jgi:hypothetical protein
VIQSPKVFSFIYVERREMLLCKGISP